MTNSQVPFIQVNTYRTHEQLENLASQYPNAIIFYSYTGQETNGLTDSAIWAHGKEYKTGGGDTHYKLNVVNASSNPGSRVSTANVTTGAIDGWTPSLGDIFIEKEIISGEGTESEKAQYTAYVWSYVAGGSSRAWRALDGNYNASNVYFTNDITLAGNYDRVGNVTKTVEGTGTLSASGLSLKALFDSIFTEEIYPTTEQTSTATLTVSVTAPQPVIKNGSSKVESGSLIAVGTSGLKLQSATAGGTNTPGGVEQTTVSGFTYGYASDINGTDSSDNTSISVTRDDPTPIEDTKESPNKFSISVTVSKFSGSSVTNPTASTSASNVTVTETTLGNVEYGANSVTFAETGRRYTANVDGIPAKYIESNIGNYSEDHKSTAVSATTLTTTAPTNSKSITIYGAYPIVTNGKSASVTDGATETNAAYSSSNISLPLSNTYKVSNGNITNQTFYVGFGQQVKDSVYWELYLPSSITNVSAYGYNSLSKDYDTAYTFVKGTYESGTYETMSGVTGNYYKWRCNGDAGKSVVKITLS